MEIFTVFLKFPLFLFSLGKRENLAVASEVL